MPKPELSETVSPKVTDSDGSQILVQHWNWIKLERLIITQFEMSFNEQIQLENKTLKQTFYINTKRSFTVNKIYIQTSNG